MMKRKRRLPRAKGAKTQREEEEDFEFECEEEEKIASRKGRKDAKGGGRGFLILDFEF